MPYYDESWEFQNNTSDRMLYKSNDFESTYTDPETQETFPAWKNDFEARFPEDTYEDITQLKTFVTWVMSTDTTAATGDTLDTPVTYAGTEYTQDTAAYRLAKFKAEFADYAETDSFVFYYIFTDLFLMVDSRAKNFFLGFHGGECGVEGMRRKAVAEPYDMDTALGTNNEGSLVFPYWLEDTDHLEGGADVFNGQQSVLWNNLRETHRAEITGMYKTLRSTGAISYSLIEGMYERHQSKWPEAIVNEDSRFKYILPLTDPDPGKEPTGAYLPMEQGLKTEQRKWWLYNRIRYEDSKYNAGDALLEVIQLRGYAKADITVTPYAAIYPTVKYGSYLVQTRGSAGVPATLACPLDNVNDTEIYIYSASQVASAGDLSGLKVGFADFSMATHLQEIKVGDAGANYTNANLNTLTVGSNKLLRKIDARNCTALGTGNQKSVDLSGCEIIEEVYFDGTAIQGVSLPNGGVLKKLHLPDTVTNLTIRNQKLITEFVCAGYSNITTLRLENNSAAVDDLAILQAIPANTRVRLVGFYWEAQDATEIEDILDTLDTMRGLDESGNNMDTAQCVGEIHTESLTGAEVAEFNARYPYITISADMTTSFRRYHDEDGTLLKTVECHDGVPQSGPPTGMSKANSSDGHYSYTFAGWSKTQGSATPDDDALDNVIADRDLYAVYTATVRTYTATWKNSNGTVLETDENVPWGTTPTYNGATPQNPTSGGGSFTAWTPTPGPITGDTNYIATYTPLYTATFVRGSADGGGTLYTAQFEEGATVTYGGTTPTSTQGTAEDYPFEGWTPALGPIYANTTYTALFGSPVQDVEITDTWDTIIANIDNGTYKTAYKIGNYKPLDLGTEGIINMQIVAFDSDELASGGYAPITFLAKDKFLKTYLSSPVYTDASQGWNGCKIRTHLTQNVLPLISNSIKERIVEVNKYSGIGANTIITTADKLWIPSIREIAMSGGDSIYTIEQSGVRYEKIYKQYPNMQDNKRKRTMQSGSAYSYITRTMRNTTKVEQVTSSGNFDPSGSTATGLYGMIVLGFCLGLESETITDST